MAPAISKFDMENGRKRRDMYAVKPAIPLERPKRAKYDPSELVKFELYRNPEDTSSAKYTISIPKFSGGLSWVLLITDYCLGGAVISNYRNYGNYGKVTRNYCQITVYVCPLFYRNNRL